MVILAPHEMALFKPIMILPNYPLKLFGGRLMATQIIIRPFSEGDAAQVRELFITVNRLLSPAHLRDAFEVYIERALAEEIDCIPAYYGEHAGSFWVAVKDDKVVGMFGLEGTSDSAMELRRMYVDPSVRRQGVARQMLKSAEDECRRSGNSRLTLSTSEIQAAALALYKEAGYSLLHDEIADVASNKTIGSGIRRYYFEKTLG
jgi:GNAT superfamily N-acetyltransferase